MTTIPEIQSTSALPSAYIQLVNESAKQSVIWHQDAVFYTPQEMAQHLANGSDVAVKYVQLLLHEAMAGLTKNNAAVVPEKDIIDVSMRPYKIFAEHFAKMAPETEVWRYISRKYVAGEMPELLEQADEGAFTLLTDVMRVIRDRHARRAQALLANTQAQTH